MTTPVKKVTFALEKNVYHEAIWKLDKDYFFQGEDVELEEDISDDEEFDEKEIEKEIKEIESKLTKEEKKKKKKFSFSNLFKKIGKKGDKSKSKKNSSTLSQESKISITKTTSLFQVNSVIEELPENSLSIEKEKDLDNPPLILETTPSPPPPLVLNETEKKEVQMEERKELQIDEKKGLTIEEKRQSSTRSPKPSRSSPSRIGHLKNENILVSSSKQIPSSLSSKIISENTKSSKIIQEDTPKPSKIIQEDTSKSSKIMQEDAPKPFKLNREDIPKPSKIIQEDTPKPSKIIQEDAPKLSKIMQEDAPKPFKLNREDKPKPSKIIQEDAPKLSKIIQEDTSKSSKIMQEDAPNPSKLNREDIPKPSKISQEAKPKQSKVIEDAPKPSKIIQEDAPKPSKIIQGNVSKSSKRNNITFQLKKLDSPEMYKSVLKSRKTKSTSFLPTLIQCRGKSNFFFRQVPLHISSLNKEDCFVLDNDSKIYCWSGSLASSRKKRRMAIFAERIKSEEKKGPTTIVTLDEKDEDPTFWSLFGGKELIQNDGKTDPFHEFGTWNSECRLFIGLEIKSKDTIDMEPIYVTYLSYMQLDSDKLFFFDTKTECFVWIGKKVSGIHKRIFCKKAEEYATQHRSFDWTRLYILKEGRETVLFKEKFSDWPSPFSALSSPPTSRAITSTKSSQTVPANFNINQMLVPVKSRRAGILSNNILQVEMWLVPENEQDQLIPIPEEENGTFYSHHGYVVACKYMKKDTVRCNVYAWHGRYKRKDPRTTKAAEAMVKKRTETKVRFDYEGQGKESESFRSIFQGAMLVYFGIHPFLSNSNMGTSSKTKLFHYKRNCATEVPIVTSQALNSLDAFIVHTSQTTFIWYGQYCSKEIKSAALSFANKRMRENLQTVVEGEEEPDFFQAIGDQKEYAKVPYFPENQSSRFFIIRSDSIREVVTYSQQDLGHSTVLLLDVYFSLYLWVGPEAKSETKSKALRVGQEYAELIKLQRGLSALPIISVTSEQEPLEFKCHFEAWDNLFPLRKSSKRNGTCPNVDSIPSDNKKLET